MIQKWADESDRYIAPEGGLIYKLYYILTGEIIDCYYFELASFNNEHENK